MAAAATVPRQPAAPASMMARVDRLDLLLGYLEEMHRTGTGKASPAHSATATTASSPSTPAAAAGGGRLGLVSSDDDDESSAAGSTPRGSKSWRRHGHPRPAKEVLEEARAKGSLIDRIALLEHRLLKMEEGMELEITPAYTEKAIHHQLRTMSEEDPSGRRKTKTKTKTKGLKSLVKSCVRGNLKTKD